MDKLQQEYVRETGGVRSRGPNLQTVEERLIAGERPGRDLFSYSQSDKSGCDHVDHLAKLLYDSCRANTKPVQGMFFKKSSPNPSSITEYGYS